MTHDSDAIEDMIGLIEPALTEIEYGRSEAEALRDLQTLLRNLLADFIRMIERHPGVEAATADLYAVATALVRDAGASTVPALQAAPFREACCASATRPLPRAASRPPAAGATTSFSSPEAPRQAWHRALVLRKRRRKWTRRMPAPALAELRQEIDRIDEAMHRLLMERGEIIDRLIAVKKTARVRLRLPPRPRGLDDAGAGRAPRRPPAARHRREHLARHHRAPSPMCRRPTRSMPTSPAATRRCATRPGSISASRCPIVTHRAPRR